MRQKLLLFISILILNCLFALAEESSLPELPALPVTSEEEIVDNTSGKPKSFFEKIKSFFGFGDDANDDAITTESNAEEQAIDSTSTPLDQSLEEATEEVPEIIPTIAPPLGSTDEGPMSIMIPTLPADDDTVEDLQVPSGFDDDIKDSSEYTPQVSKIDSVPEVAEFAVPTPDDGEDKLELPSFGAESEDKTDKTKDVVEKKSDSDQSVPAALETLPEISSVGDSDKVENQDAVKVE